MRFRTKTILGVGLSEMVLLASLVGSALYVLHDSNEVELTQRVKLGSKLLAVAAKDASYEAETMYPNLLKEAQAENNGIAVRALSYAKAAVTEHVTK